ncbi:hypothetical protein QQ045_015892 [Rhodiola kirilowii]
MTFEEVKAKYTDIVKGLPTRFRARGPSKSSNNLMSTSNDDLPKSVDVRKTCIVTRVKEQGCVGASWAYAVVGGTIDPNENFDSMEPSYLSQSGVAFWTPKCPDQHKPFNG